MHPQQSRQLLRWLHARLSLCWIGAQIKVKHLLKCFAEPGAVGSGHNELWGKSLEESPENSTVSHSWALGAGLKGQEWCLPKDLLHHRTEASLYLPDLHRRNTQWDCNRAWQWDEVQSTLPFICATRTGFGLDGTNRLSRQGTSLGTRRMSRWSKHEPQP